MNNGSSVPLVKAFRLARMHPYGLGGTSGHSGPYYEPQSSAIRVKRPSSSAHIHRNWMKLIATNMHHASASVQRRLH